MNFLTYISSGIILALEIHFLNPFSYFLRPQDFAQEYGEVQGSFHKI
jgi:hypothetical protein